MTASEKIPVPWHAFLKWNSTMLGKVRKTKACWRCVRRVGAGLAEPHALGNADRCTACLRELLSAGYSIAAKGPISSMDVDGNDL